MSTDKGLDAMTQPTPPPPWWGTDAVLQGTGVASCTVAGYCLTSKLSCCIVSCSPPRCLPTPISQLTRCARVAGVVQFGPWWLVQL
jgi:hypothetical protein